MFFLCECKRANQNFSILMLNRHHLLTPRQGDETSSEDKITKNVVHKRILHKKRQGTTSATGKKRGNATSQSRTKQKAAAAML